MGMRFLMRTRIALVMCLLGVAFCANGFVLLRRSRPRRSRFPTPIRRRSRGPALISSQTKREVLCEDEHPVIAYPTGTSKNISANGTHGLAPDIAYFYLRNTLGLSEETMWKITLEAESLLGMTPRNLEKKVALLRRTVGLSDEDVRTVLGKQPAVLHYSADRNLAPTILFLVRALDLSRGELRKMIVACPSILGYSLGNLGKKIAFFCSLEYSEDGLRELLVGTPKLLTAAVDTGLVPRMKFLLNEIQFSLNELRTLYEKNPRLLLYSLNNNLREKIVFFFILHLGLQPEHVRKILLSYPRIMDYNLNSHIRPISEFFVSELQFSAAELGSIVLKFPRLFSYSLFKIKHVAGFLRYELGLDPRQAKRVIFQAPQVLGLDTEGNLKKKLDFLRYRLDLTPGELGSVFSKMPTLSTVGVEGNVRPKLDYLEHALKDHSGPCGHPLKEAILKQPTLLGYSLQGRIQPRMEQLVAVGIPPEKISVGISMTEANFQKWLSSQSGKRPQKDSGLDPTKETLVALRNRFSETIEFLESTLQLNRSESDSLLPSLRSISTVREDVEGTIKLLLDLADADVGRVRAAVLEWPHSLSLPLRKLTGRVDDLRSSSHTPKEMIEMVTMTDEDYQACISLDILEKMLNFTRKEIESIARGSKPIVWRNAAPRLAGKITFLLSRWSREDVKNAILTQPKLISYPLEKLQKATNVPTTRKSKCSTFWFRNESGAVLRDALELSEEGVNFVLKHSCYLPVRDPEEFLVPKLKYLLSEFDGCEKHVTSCLLANPRLLDYSLDDRIRPRMELLIEAGLVRTQISDVISLSPQEINRRMELRTGLNLTDTELDLLLPMKAWLKQRLLRENAGPIIQYLTSELNGSIDDLKQILLEEPKLLTQSRLKMIQLRMHMLVESGCPPNDIGKIVVLSKRKAEEYCLKHRLGRRLGFSLKQVDGLFESTGVAQLSLSGLEEKLDFFLHHVFHGSERKLKAAILQDPELLNQSLDRTTRPRLELLHFLESIGLGCSDVSGFFTLSDSAFKKGLLPKAKTWCPPVSSESNKKHAGEDMGSGLAAKRKNAFAMLKDFSRPLSLTYSDETNREGARLVHWR